MEDREKSALKAHTRSPTSELAPIGGRGSQIVGLFVDSGIRRYESLVLAAALSVLTGFSLSYAARQPFTGDEYFVLDTALSGSPSAVWHILETAPLSVDPPLYHFLLVYWIRIFGPGELSVRVPSVLSYTLMSFLLYRFVRRYVDIYTALTVLALSFQCGAFVYSYHARPYTLVLAADAAAVLSWSALIHTREDDTRDDEKRYRRRLALVGLFLAIFIALGSHWFGFLVLVPIAFGEALRTWKLRRVDFLVWGTLLGGAATALPYVRLMKAAVKYRALPWKPVQLSDIVHSYRLVLDPCIVPLSLVLVAFAVARIVPAKPSTKLRTLSVPMPVFAGIATFAGLPFFAFLVAKFVSNVLEPRYVLPCTLGLLVLVSLAIRDLADRRAKWISASILIVAAYASLYYYSGLSGMPAGGDADTFADARVFSAIPDLPILPNDYDLFLRLKEHGAASVRDRCVLATGLDSIRILHRNTEFLATDALRRWTKLPIEDLAPFLKAHPQFYLIERPDVGGWLSQWLVENHADVMLRGTYGGNPVYLVQVSRQ